MSSSTLSDIAMHAQESLTKGLSVITTDHRYIHECKAFTLSGNTGSVAAAGTYTIGLVTPHASKGYVHFRPISIASSANTVEVRMAEGSTITGGSAATPWNRNRNATRSSEVTCTIGVTLSAEGAILPITCIGSGAKVSTAQGGGSGESDEIVLKPETTYSIYFENIGTVTATEIFYNIFWYEEDEGVC